MDTNELLDILLRNKGNPDVERLVDLEFRRARRREPCYDGIFSNEPLVVFPPKVAS